MVNHDFSSANSNLTRLCAFFPSLGGVYAGIRVSQCDDCEFKPLNLVPTRDFYQLKFLSFLPQKYRQQLVNSCALYP